MLGALDEGRSGLVAIRGDDVTLDADALIDRIAAATDPRVATPRARGPAWAARDRFVIAQAAALEPVRRDGRCHARRSRVIVPLRRHRRSPLLIVVHRRTAGSGPSASSGVAARGRGASALGRRRLAGRPVREPGSRSAPVVQRVTPGRRTRRSCWPLGGAGDRRSRRPRRRDRASRRRGSSERRRRRRAVERHGRAASRDHADRASRRSARRPWRSPGRRRCTSSRGRSGRRSAAARGRAS